MSRDLGFWILGWDLGLGVRSLLLGFEVLMDLRRAGSTVTLCFYQVAGTSISVLQTSFPPKMVSWVLWGPIENQMEKETKTETESEVMQELGI